MKLSATLFSLSLAAVCLAGCNSPSSKNNDDAKETAQADSARPAAEPEKQVKFPGVTREGIGELTIGTPLRNCLSYHESGFIPTREEAEGAELQYGFYNKTGIKLMGLGDSFPYLLLYNDEELMAAAEIEESSDSHELTKIIVYSPKLRLENGIHVGMSAQELADKYDAEIRFSEGAEDELLCFDVEGISDKFTLMATAKEINREQINSEYGDTPNTDFILQPKDVKDCKLAAIVIKNNYN